MPISVTDRAYLEAAIELAAQGLYSTTPNPRVGCLIVKGHDVVGRGFHVRAGGPHAEAIALAQAGVEAHGATAYVSLEPCAHHGRTPPCSDALIVAGIARVVIGHRDPDRRTAGKGLAKLQAVGIAVDAVDLPAVRSLNCGFFARHELARPWIRIKVGASLDGRTAMASGESQWITGEAARRDVQHWRARSCAIVTGIGTVVADDPALTVRAGEYAVDGVCRQPLKVIADSSLAIPAAARVLKAPGEALIVTAEGAMRRDLGRAEVVAMGDGRVDLGALFADLARRGMNEVLVEAGPRLTGALLEAGLWDELIVYLAPKLLGASGRPLAAFERTRLGDAIAGSVTEVTPVGSDVRVRVLRSSR